MVLIFASIMYVSVADGTEIILNSTIDVPDRTVTFENQAFEITEIGNYKTNQDIGFSVDAPGVEDMLVVLYDRDKLSVWFKRFYNASGSVVTAIPANKINEAGTYVIAVSKERNIIDAIPVVISDYDLTVKPESNKLIAGKKFDVEVDISKNGVPVNTEKTVKVVIAKGSASIETNATAIKPGAYKASIEIPLAANGTFSLYSVITTERKLMNYPEILGIASGGNIEITQPSAEKTTSFISWPTTMLTLLGAALLMRKLYEN
ncbi:MAG: hypothetical protein OIN85_05435 [Candidatus Methanoperedens sp.]|nr:hypothetical protein [Candidatus Methanoperedens sp.]